MDFYKTDPFCSEKMKELKEISWDFENLVFEGGGAKVVAYAGCCKILEELGVLQKCKRFAGTSGGAIAAALLATEHTPDEMRELMGLPLEDLLLDSWWGRFSIIPNIWRKFGWCEAKGFLDKMREIMQKKTGCQDITFKQVYEKYGKELCIVATNVTTSTVEFFHPKTTPHMSVALAVRCSVSLPGWLQPVEVTLETGLKQLYVDGGVVLNFPLHVFDGWALSMNENDTLFKKLNKGKPMFGSSQEINERTLGVNLYTFAEDDVMKLDFIQRLEGKGLTRPRTTLSRQRSEEAARLLNDYGQQTAIVVAVNLFLKVLQEMHTGLDDNISLDTFNGAVEELQEKHKGTVEVLFQKTFTLKKARELIKSNDGKMNMDDMIAVIEKHGFRWSQLLFGGVQTQPANTKQFAAAVLNSCMGISRMTALKPGDSDRTIGVFTDYIYTADFKLEKGDIDHLVKQGQTGTVEYFNYILKKARDPHHPPDIRMQQIHEPSEDSLTDESDDGISQESEDGCIGECMKSDNSSVEMVEYSAVAIIDKKSLSNSEEVIGHSEQGYAIGESMPIKGFGVDSNVHSTALKGSYISAKSGADSPKLESRASVPGRRKHTHVTGDADIMQKIFNLTHGDR